MEFSKKELALIEQMVERKDEQEAIELTDLQLTLVGGGSGDVVFH